MPIFYLEPEDLTPAQAARVLDFLNLVASASEIATRVKVLGQRDIGLRLGQKLLGARAAHGGRFTDLGQVRAVPLIGPERFTQLCAAVLGLNLDRPIPGHLDRSQPQAEFGGSPHGQFDFPGDNARCLQMDLACHPQPAWLGLALDVTVQVRDSQGRSLANRLLTVETSAGTLEAARGFAVQRASAVQARTGADGTVRLLLRHANIEPLTADQQHALEEVLARLDPAAETPVALRDTFLQIAREYQEERRQTLRAALDIFSREWKDRFLDRLNPSDFGFFWPIETSVVRVSGHDEAHPAAVLAQALLPVHWKNWVGAWFEFLGAYLADQASLQREFAAAKRRGAQGYRMVDDLLAEAHGFVAQQSGLAGGWLSQRVVKTAVQEFLGRQVADVDPATQRELFSHLEIAAEQITAADLGTIGLVQETRTNLVSKFALGTDEIRKLHGEIMARAQEVQMSYADFTARYTAFNEALTSFRRDRDSFAASCGAFNADYANFRTDYSKFQADQDRFRNDYGTFRNDYGTFTNQYDTFQASCRAFAADNRAFAANYAAFRADYENFNRTMARVDPKFEDINSRITALNDDLARLKNERGMMNRELNAVKADIAAIKDKIRTSPRPGGG